MSLAGLTDPGFGRGANPRNAWSRLARALDIAEAADPPERWYLARRIAESVRYAPDLAPGTLDTYLRRLDRLRPEALPPAQINSGADYLSHPGPLRGRPFRRLDAHAEHPAPFPYGLALPAIQGNQNDYGFLLDAATSLDAAGALSPPRFHVFYDAARARNPQEIAALMQGLAAQRYPGRIRLTILGASEPPPAVPPGGPIADLLPGDILDEAAQGQIMHRLDEADIALFLSGTVELDPDTLARIAWPARITQALVQPLIHLGPDEGPDQDAGFPRALEHARWWDAQRVDDHFDRMLERHVHLCAGAFFAQIVAEGIGWRAVPESLGGNPVLREDVFHVALVLFWNALQQVFGRERPFLVGDARRDDQIDAVGLAVDVVVDPLELDF